MGWPWRSGSPTAAAMIILAPAFDSLRERAWDFDAQLDERDREAVDDLYRIREDEKT